ncbi:MAG: hypothetical protein ABI877_13590, partial [Gemmatimonadaceae bacterium]
PPGAIMRHFHRSLIRSLIPVAAIFLGACVDTAPVPTGVASPALAQSTADDGTRGYVAQLLPQLPGNSWSAALAINSAGVAVGFSDFTFRTDPPNWGWGPTVCTPYLVATIFDHGRVTSLHAELIRALGGSHPCYTASIASGINDRGDVVGTVFSGMFFDTEQGFFWSHATGVILHREIGRQSNLTGVNNTGLAVGNNRFDGMNWRDFVWSPLGPPPPLVFPRYRTYYAWGINDAGRRAGCWKGRPYTADLDGTFRHLADECGTAPSLLGRSYWFQRSYLWQNLDGGINAEGTVVFNTYLSAPRRWDASAMRSTSVGWSPGGASGISDRGRIVGWRSAAAFPRSVAMTVGAHGTPVVLPRLTGMAEAEPYAVNACGDIAGAAFANSIAHAVIWTRGVCDRP